MLGDIKTHIFLILRDPETYKFINNFCQDICSGKSLENRGSGGNTLDQNKIEVSGQ